MLGGPRLIMVDEEMRRGVQLLQVGEVDRVRALAARHHGDALALDPLVDEVLSIHVVPSLAVLG